MHFTENQIVAFMLLIPNAMPEKTKFGKRIQLQSKSKLNPNRIKGKKKELLVDLSNGAIEEDDGGVVEPLHRVLPRELQIPYSIIFTYKYVPLCHLPSLRETMGMIGRSPLTKCEVKFWIDLAKDEYGKGVSAEQRGLLNEAICHHENARRIFFELYPNHVSPLPSSSSCDPNERFRLTMDEWIGPSTERLDELYRRQADRDNELYEQRAGVQSFASLDKVKISFLYARSHFVGSPTLHHPTHVVSVFRGVSRFKTLGRSKPMSSDHRIWVFVVGF
ncbi:uncharacterized protein A4U43_C09F4470 [Asparagus officinalis]|uniref:Uncharacterized protein n=1 Tax=Asparagus officinalis TaxID=4686 RepID=A0A5P1E5T1_ASPOF|nr:uncharacterized protein A4U43_C09F4470 [Asparagus officinalis]